MIRRATFRFWAVILLGCLLCTNARADRLVFKDGQELLGKIMSQNASSVTFASKEGAKVVVRKYSLSKVKSIIPELGDKNSPFPKPKLDPDDPENPKNKVVRTGPVTETDRVVFLIDRSSSMGLGSRLENAVKLAEDLMGKFEGETRLQIFAYDERAEPIQRDYENVVPSKSRIFQSALKRITVNKRAGTNIELALKRVLKAKPKVIHLFTDGVERSDAGAKYDDLLKSLLKLNRKKVVIHTHAFQSGFIPYFGGEPKKEARDFLKQLAEKSGGKSSAQPAEAVAQDKEVNAEIVVTLNGKVVKSLKVGERYDVELKVKGLKGNPGLYEYLAGSPVLMRSVNASKRDVVRRVDLPVVFTGKKVVAPFKFKVVASTNSYASSRGYIGVVSGGTVGFFFDALGRWVSLKLPVE